MIFLLVTPLQIIYFLEFIGRFSPSKKSMYVCMYVCGCLRLQAELPFSGLFRMETKKLKQVSAWYKC